MAFCSFVAIIAIAAMCCDALPTLGVAISSNVPSCVDPCGVITTNLVHENQNIVGNSQPMVLGYANTGYYGQQQQQQTAYGGQQQQQGSGGQQQQQSGYTGYYQPAAYPTSKVTYGTGYYYPYSYSYYTPAYVYPSVVTTKVTHRPVTGSVISVGPIVTSSLSNSSTNAAIKFITRTFNTTYPSNVYIQQGVVAVPQTEISGSKAEANSNAKFNVIAAQQQSSIFLPIVNTESSAKADTNSEASNGSSEAAKSSASSATSANATTDAADTDAKAVPASEDLDVPDLF